MHIRKSSKDDASQLSDKASSKCMAALGTNKVLVACSVTGHVLGYLHAEPLPSKHTAGVLRIAGLHFDQKIMTRADRCLDIGAQLVNTFVQSNRDRNIVTANVLGLFKEAILNLGFEEVAGKNYCIRRAETLTRKLAAYEAPFAVQAAEDMDAESPVSDTPTKKAPTPKKGPSDKFDEVADAIQNDIIPQLEDVVDELSDSKPSDHDALFEDKKTPKEPEDDELAMTFDDEPSPKENLGPKKKAPMVKTPAKEKVDEDADGPAPATAGRQPLPHHSGLDRTRVLGYNITDPAQDLVPEEKKADEEYDSLLAEPETDEVVTPPVDQPRKGVPGPGYLDPTPAKPLTIRPVVEADAPLNIFDLDDMQGQTTEFTNADNTEAVREGTDPVHQPMEVPRNNFERKEADQADDAKQPGTQMEQFQQKQRSNEKFEQAPRNQAQPNSEEGHTHHGSKKTSAAKAPSEADIKDIIIEAEGRNLFDADTTDAEKRGLAVEFLNDIEDETTVSGSPYKDMDKAKNKKKGV